MDKIRRMLLCYSFVLFGVLAAKAQSFSWATNVSSSGNSVAYDVVTDNAGNTYTVGSFSGAATFGSGTFTSLGSTDVFVCKRSASGTVLWTVRAGGSSQDDAKGVTLDTAGSIIVVGNFGGTATFGTTTFTSNGGNDIFIMKLDTTGSITWATRYGGTGTEYANDVAVSPYNSVFVVGNFTGTATFGSNNFPSNGGSDVYLLRLTGALGSLVSVSRYGGTSSEYGNAVAVDGSSRASFTGYFSGSLAFGSTTLTSAGGTDIFLAITSGSTNVNTAYSYGGTGDDQGLGLATDADKNFHITGSFNGSLTIGSTTLVSAGGPDGFISKISLLGAEIWTKQMGGSTFDEISSVAIAPNGDVVCSGYFSNTAAWGSIQKSSAGDRDVFVAKLLSNGNYSWVASAGGTYLDNCHGVAVNANTVFIAGEFKAAGTFGSFNLTTSTGGTTDTEPFTAALGLCPTAYFTLNVSSCGPYALNAQTYSSSGTYYQALTSAQGCDSIITLNVTVNGTGDANLLWAKPVSGNGSLTQGVTTDASGNVFSTGWFDGLSDFNPGAGVFNMTSAGTSDIFVTKLSATGSFLWAKQFGSTGINKGKSVVTDAAGNVYVYGTFSGTVDFDPSGSVSNLTSTGDADLFVLKLDANGNFVWAKQFGGNLADAAGNILLDATGNILVCGGLQGTGDFDPGAGVTTLTSAGNYDLFVAKLSSTGNLVWVKQAGSTGSDMLYHIEQDASGAIYGTGQFSNTVDFGPGSGTTSYTSLGNTDVFIFKLNTNGNLQWAKQIGSTLGDYGTSLTTKTEGYIYITGHYEALTDFDPGAGTYNINATTAIGDFFILKLDTAANFVWATKIGAAGEEYCNDLVTDANGDLLLIGTFSATTDFNPLAPINNLTSQGSKDIFIMKMDANGLYKWAYSIGNTIMDDAYDLHIDNANNIYMAGAFGLSADFDPGVGEYILTAVVSSDAYTAKFGSCCLAGTGTLTATACQSYVSPSGNYTWTTAGTYSDTITSGLGCDSILTIQLTIKQKSSSTINQSICQGQSYFFNGFNRTTQGTYLDTLVNAVGCDSIITLNLTVNALPAASISPASVTICNGQSATLTASGGTQYAWSNSGGSSAQAIFNPTTTTTYTVTVTDANTCSATASRSVTVNPLPTASISPASVTICNGQSATLTASGGTQFAWSNSGGSSAQATFSPTTTTTYTVTVTNANSCSATASRSVTVNPLPAASISPASVTICNGQSATLTASGGTQYAWSNSGGSNAQASFSPTTTTTYTVTVTDANTCSATASRSVTVNALPTAGISPATVTICNGQSATLTASGGTQYAWSNSGGSNAQTNFSPTTTTTYTVTVTDANSCSATASRSVTVNALPTAGISPASVTICNGQTATLTASGGTQYAWSNSGGSNAQATFSPTTTTTYTVTVTDANTCSATASRSVTVNALPTAGISPATVTICNGQSATLTASGGTQYTWSNSGGSNAQATFSPTTTTTYTVTVTDANTCSATASRSVTVNPLPAASISPASVTICNGQTATLTASGGTQYAWSNSGGSNAQANFSPTTTTTYTVTVTDANSCSATASRSVTVNALPTAGISPASVTICNGQSATLTASGGTQYAWSNSGGSNAQASFSPTSTTTYTVTVTNANNCSATASRSVTVNALPIATINGPTTICSGLSATLTAGGGTGYAWSNGLGSNSTITVSPATNTTYSVTVTDGNSCTASASQTVSVTTTPVAAITGATQTCNGNSVTLTANGGNTYQWSNGLGTSSTITVSPSTTATYTVTATIGANCSATASQTITVYQPAASQFSQTICSGSSYLFNGQQVAQSGIYRDTLQTVHGCDSIVTLTLVVASPLTGSFSQTICAGQSYLFNGVALTAAGNYTDTLQNINGCDSIVTLTLTVNNVLQTAISYAICSGDTFQFGNKALTQAGSYTDTLTSATGCDSIVLLTLTLNALPTPTISANGSVLSTQSFAGYQWLLEANTIPSATAQSYTATANGNYTVAVTDTNGCAAVSAIYNLTGIGIIDISRAAIKVYPNPAEDRVMIELPAGETVTLTITDVKGRLLMEQQVTDKQQVDVSSLAAGLYNLQFHLNTGTATTKLIKLR